MDTVICEKCREDIPINESVLGMKYNNGIEETVTICTHCYYGKL